MRKKAFCLLILTAFLVGMFPLHGFGLDVVPQTGEDAVRGKPWVDRDEIDTSFSALRYPISSTGASSGTKYKTIQTTITIGGYSATYDIDSLGTPPAPGQTINETIVISAENLAQKMGIPKEDIEYMLNSGEEAYMSSVVAITQNGVTVGTYDDYSSLAAAMRSYGFGQESINDVASRWGKADDPLPVVNLRTAGIKVFKKDTGQQVTLLEEGVQYILQTTFKNDSVYSGTVNLRAYQSALGYELEPLSSVQSAMITKPMGAKGTPNDTIVQNWEFTAWPAQQYYFTTTINYNIDNLGSAIKESFSGHMESTYLDNQAATLLGGYVDPPDDYWDNLFPGRDVESKDLAVTNVTVTDSSGRPVYAPQANQALNVKATFVSTFNEGGYARIRLYRYQSDHGTLSLVGSAKNVYFEPNATYEHTWDGLVVGSGKYLFIPAINVQNSTNDLNNWNEETFNGQREATYANNTLQYNLTGSELNPVPNPGYWTSGPGYYPPKTAEMVPIYETVPIYGWKEVDYESNKPKLKTRLIE